MGKGEEWAVDLYILHDDELGSEATEVVKGTVPQIDCNPSCGGWLKAPAKLCYGAKGRSMAPWIGQPHMDCGLGLASNQHMLDR